MFFSTIYTMNKLEIRNISKKFGDFFANKDISINVKENEVHALLGENGAGKSTLMSVIFGLYNPEEGEILIDGKLAKIKTPKDANKFGIAMLPQHFKLVDDMTALENIILGYESATGKRVDKMFVNKKQAKTKIEDTQKKYKIKLDLNKRVSKLSTSDKQKVELLKMLWRDNDILIFDEPTSILTPQEIEEFLKMIKNLQADNKTIIIITHKLDEIKAVADNVSILRKGKLVKTVSAAKTSKEKLAELMVGEAVDLNLSTIERTKNNSKEITLSLESVSLKHKAKDLHDISLKVNKGEIVGIAAIEGNGQSELFKVISGLYHPSEGKVIVSNEDITKWNVAKRYRNKKQRLISHIPEDRHEHGLFLDQTAVMNSVSQDIDLFKTKFLTLNTKKINSHYKKVEKEFDVRGVQNKKTLARSLSGGNQQKLILGREMMRQSELLLAVHPTRGLDVGAIRNVYSKMIEYRNNGGSVLFTSGELDEILQVSDRVLVMNEGKIVGEFSKSKADKNKIGILMMGGKHD